jgi:hypothetical protein
MKTELDYKTIVEQCGGAEYIGRRGATVLFRDRETDAGTFPVRGSGHTTKYFPRSQGRARTAQRDSWLGKSLHE